MEKSQTISELAKALVAFQLKNKTIGFDANNPFFKSKYATLTALVEKSRVELANAGLAVSQLGEGAGGVTTILMHTSGEYISSTMTLKPVKEDPQGYGSAITYTRRYAYAAILGLVSDEDDDGNAATHTNGVHKEDKPLNRVASAVNKAPDAVPVITLKDRVIGTAQTKFATPDEFKLWRIENNLSEDLNKASETDLNYILAVMREYKKKDSLGLPEKVG